MKSIFNIKLTLCFLTLISLGCSDRTHLISTDSSDNFSEALGLYDENDVSITYDDSLDKVTISATNRTGDDIPLALSGVRFSLPGGSSAEKICSILGFIDLNRSSLSNINSPVSRKIDNFSTNDNTKYTRIPFTEFPVFHIEPRQDDSFLGMFNVLPEVSSYYFTTPKSENALYINQLSCYGTTQAHFKNNIFNRKNFLISVLEAQLSQNIELSSNHYQENKFFLIANAKDSWELKKDLSENNNSHSKYARLRKDINPLQLAKKGAQDICEKSGHKALTFYTVKYAYTKDTPETIYEFNESLGLWASNSAPEKHNLVVSINDQYYDINHTLEVPHLYLDKIYCH